MNDSFTLIDEDARPPLRQRIGRLMSGSAAIDFAVQRIRLAALDLTEEELAGLRRCRVLIGRLDADTLLDAAPGAAGARRAAVARLLAFARSGRLEVRSAGLASWTPDFCVARSSEAVTSVLGAIYFGSPQLLVGPSFTVVSGAADAAALLGRRFEQLWENGYDVLPAIIQVLERADGVGAGAGADGRTADSG